MDAARRERIRDDLQGTFRGDLLLDDLARGLYSTDASLFRVEPLGVAVPLDEEDLQILVRYAAEQHIPLIPRGAGTGVAGESLGTGLVVDLSVHFRAISEIKSNTVRVQPGVVYRNLNAQLAAHGRHFAPDPASGAACTVGGMLATNASGARAFAHGYTRDHVAACRVVWDNGEAAAVARGSWLVARDSETEEGDALASDDSANGSAVSRATSHEPRATRTEEIARATAILLRANAGLIAERRPRTPFNRCGYLLHDVLDGETLDLPKLLVGSEGTLAFFTEATLKTVPLPAGRGAVLLAFASLDAALKAAQHARTTRPAACELVDRRLLSLARGQSPELARSIPAAAEAVLLVEYERDSHREAREAVLCLIDRVHRKNHLSLLSLPAFEPEAVDRLWQVREAALPSLYGLGKGPRPLAFVEDVGVPPEELGPFLTRLQDVLQRFETTASFLIHAATGQVHTRPFLDLDNPADREKLWPIAEAVHGLTLEFGGTVSTQHGTGLARTPWVSRQYGKLYPVFRELKQIFDPQGILNPGKIVGPDPSQPAWPLRPGFRVESGFGEEEEATQQTRSAGEGELPPDPEPRTPSPGPSPNPKPDPEPRTLTPLLLWEPGDLTTQVAACNGCGDCRTEAPDSRMCPTFRVTHAEAASPRAKANLLRQILGPDGDPKRLSADEVRDVADLCVNCKMCAHECPAHVNVPKLMLEAKAANQTEHGLDRSDWVLARTENFATLGSNFAPVVNFLLGSRPVRWMLERFFGVSRRRRLPAFAGRNFLRRAARKGWTAKKCGVRSAECGMEAAALASASGSSADASFRTPHPALRTRKIAYFVDVFANYNDPLVAEAAVAVLRHHGFEVYVPPEQRGCGMAPLAQGDVETAREAVLHNLRLFADLVREGYAIVCSEPTAALMFRQDAAYLIDDPDVRLVAENTYELTGFLADLHRAGRLRTDFRPLDLTLGHHVPCHLKALGDGVHGPALLSLIPSLRVHTIDVSCSGMAGTFGLKARNYEASLAAGKPMLDELRRPRVLYGSTECSACRMQMEEGGGKRTLHPVQYLALAYGLLPEVGKKLREPLRGLVSP